VKAFLRAGAALLALAAVARPSAQQPAASLVIRGVTLIDGTGRPELPNATVVVEGHRIAQVSTQAVAPPAGAQVIDGRGKFLIPGLIDVHVHLSGGRGNGNTQPITPQQEAAGMTALHSFLYAGLPISCCSTPIRRPTSTTRRRSTRSSRTGGRSIVRRSTCRSTNPDRSKVR
jgi:hypothetical protein